MLRAALMDPFLLIGFIAIPAVLVAWLVILTYVRRVIVRRYQELGLDGMAYFQHSFFEVFGHPSWKPWFFSLHLFVVSVVPLRILRMSSAFGDLESRDALLKHFSFGERAVVLAVWFAMLGSFVAMSLGLAFAPH